MLPPMLSYRGVIVIALLWGGFVTGASANDYCKVGSCCDLSQVSAIDLQKAKQEIVNSGWRILGTVTQQNFKGASWDSSSKLVICSYSNGLMLYKADLRNPRGGQWEPGPILSDPLIFTYVCTSKITSVSCCPLPQ